MRFEEILPKMRDEGRIGVWKDCRYRFSKGIFLQEYPSGDWCEVSISSQALTEDEWSFDPIKIRKWQWTFGFRNDCQLVSSDWMTEAEAERYMEMNNFSWMEKIYQTMTER